MANISNQLERIENMGNEVTIRSAPVTIDKWTVQTVVVLNQETGEVVSCTANVITERGF